MLGVFPAFRIWGLAIRKSISCLLNGHAYHILSPIFPRALPAGDVYASPFYRCGNWGSGYWGRAQGWIDTQVASSGAERSPRVFGLPFPAYPTASFVNTAADLRVDSTGDGQQDGLRLCGSPVTTLNTSIQQPLGSQGSLGQGTSRGLSTPKGVSDSPTTILSNGTEHEEFSEASYPLPDQPTVWLSCLHLEGGPHDLAWSGPSPISWPSSLLTVLCHTFRNLSSSNTALPWVWAAWHQQHLEAGWKVGVQPHPRPTDQNPPFNNTPGARESLRSITIAHLAFPTSGPLHMIFPLSRTILFYLALTRPYSF